MRSDHLVRELVNLIMLNLSKETKTSYSKEIWKENNYTAVGFPKVFYLKYHGYAKYFPLLAVSRYLNLSNSNYQKTSSAV